ncbi:unnamed protein product [Didymodactylos carnosus]|uniref:Uncharacterized protein n=1 Tax=Didymodactylos carnosus TaxID=1234261 RepID=A0A813Q225_9BILA|nr:unnamed protein product [Didymodactylos carnosus]CAF0760876.1 unnamed protein product [Didymodactylos carnosus]CAF3513538.1 unnamed protein product [Didymodactylos carnosus]CAF3541738.1 unnamed protein product [Didymodactylos carnosus]
MLSDIDDDLILPNIRQLLASFELICPGLYRIHCHDSIHILNEIMCLAVEWLNIQQVYTAEELLSNENLFNNYEKRINHSRMISLTDETDNEHEIVKCYGNGIQALKNQLNQFTMFCFETNTYIRKPDLAVKISNNHENDSLPVELSYINTYNNKNIYSCTYIPKHEGTYKISIFYKTRPLLKQPYTVLIRHRSSSSSATKMKVQQQNEKSNHQEVIITPAVHGPEKDEEFSALSTNLSISYNSSAFIFNFFSGIENTSIQVSHPQWFEVDCSKSDLKGSLIEVIIVDSLSSKPSSYAHASIEPLGNQKFRCDYSVSQAGLYNIIIFQAGKPLSISPIKLLVIEPQTTISSSSSCQLDAPLDYKSPISMKNNNNQKFFAYGPGLRCGYQTYPAVFYVDFSGYTEGYLEFLINNSRVTSVVNYENQFAEVCYWPDITGDLPLHILFCNEDLEISPIISKITTLAIPMSSDHPPKISVSGPGFTPNDDVVIVGKEVEFKINLDRQHVNWELNVEIYDQDYTIVPIKLQKQNDLTYICSYMPSKLCKYTISIDYGHIIIPEGNPFRIRPLSKQIELSGPAFTEKILSLHSETHFCLNLKAITRKRKTEQHLKSISILGKDCESGYSSNDDTTSAENTALSDNEPYKITIRDEKGQIKPININELSNDNLRVNFTPDSEVTYINVSVMW